MTVGVRQNIVYLLGREKIQLLQLFVGGVVQIDRSLMQRVQIRLQLLIIHLSDFRRRIVDV